MPNLITSTYEHNLQAAYHMIQKRGIVVDMDILSQLNSVVETELSDTLVKVSDTWSVALSIGKKKNHINIRSSKQLIDLLKLKGFKLPHIPPTKQQRDSGNTDHHESAGKLALQLLFSKTGDKCLKDLLTIAELMTLKSRYIDAKLYEYLDPVEKYNVNVFLSSYNVAGTLTGRRSSSKNIFGFGSNAQNLPKHTKSGEKFLECLIPRPKHVFLFVDQKSAEEWPVAALSCNHSALAELNAGVDRHTNIAAFIFGKPVADIGKKSIDRYLGKKSRHANNYGMQAKRMSLSLAQEGIFIDEDSCKHLLNKVNSYDPSVKLIFHKHIQDQISKNRFLRTPFGRERYFMGFRPGASNANVFGEAYAYIPQSVVGDNTGLAILYLETNKIQLDYECQVIQEGHDSIVQDVLFDETILWAALQNTIQAFDQEVDFNNGFKFKIPVEAELGFNFHETVALDDISKDSLIKAMNKLSTTKEL